MALLYNNRHMMSTNITHILLDMLYIYTTKYINLFISHPVIHSIGLYLFPIESIYDHTAFNHVDIVK